MDDKKTQDKSCENVPLFLEFAQEIPEHIQLEVVERGTESIVYDGNTSKSVDD